MNKPTLQSKINHINAQIDQLLHSGHFTVGDVAILHPEYKKRLANYESQLKELENNPA